MALYRVEESWPEGRRGEIVALGLYVYAGVDFGNEEGRVRKILEEATQVKIHQGRAPMGARMMFMGIWGGGPAMRVVSARQAERGNRGRGERVVAEVWAEHFKRVGLLEREGEGRAVASLRREILRAVR